VFGLDHMGIGIDNHGRLLLLHCKRAADPFLF
jgi:hypothetical protein